MTNNFHHKIIFHFDGWDDDDFTFPLNSSMTLNSTSNKFHNDESI